MAVAYRYERGDKTTFLIANRIPPFIGHLSGVVLSGLVINATGSVAASLVVMAALSVLSVAIWADSTFRGGYAERVASLKGSN